MTQHGASSQGKERSLNALVAFCAAGLAMLLFVAAGPWFVRNFGYQIFIPALVTAGFLTIAATFLSGRIEQRTGLVIVLVLALAMRLLLIGEEPLLSTDLYRYIWDGRVQNHGR